MVSPWHAPRVGGSACIVVLTRFFSEGFDCPKFVKGQGSFCGFCVGALFLKVFCFFWVYLCVLFLI